MKPPVVLFSNSVQGPCHHMSPSTYCVGGPVKKRKVSITESSALPSEHRRKRSKRGRIFICMVCGDVRESIENAVLDLCRVCLQDLVS